MQEYHIPFISTQKLFIPCGQSEESSWSSWANEALDFSAGAQKLWGMILGRQDSNKYALRITHYTYKFNAVRRTYVING